MNRYALGMVGLWAATALSGGCTGLNGLLGEPAPAPGSVLRLENVTPQRALAVAEQVLRQTYRIDSRDPEHLTLVAISPQYTGISHTGTLREGLSPARETFRKVAIVKVSTDRLGRTVMRIRVEKQRQDVVHMQAFAYQRQHSDVPTQTPIEEAPSQEPRGTVWTTVGRYRVAEQEIVKAIRAQLAPKGQ